MTRVGSVPGEVPDLQAEWFSWQSLIHVEIILENPSDSGSRDVRVDFPPVYANCAGGSLPLPGTSSSALGFPSVGQGGEDPVVY